MTHRQTSSTGRDGSGLFATRQQASQHHDVVLILAALAAFSVGLRISLPAALTPAVVIGAVLAPVWIATLSTYAWARTIMFTAVLAVANGLALAMFANVTERIEQRELLELLFMILGIFVGAGVLLWSRSILGTVPVVVLFSVATILTVSRGNAGVILNPWKFGYSVPVTLVVLALAWTTRKLWVELGALAMLAGIGMLNDSRSYFAMLLVAAVVIVWQRIAHALSRRSMFVSTVGLVAGAGFVYILATRLSASGALGEQAAARTQMQMSRSGGLLLGGRPEFAATLELMRERPWGYGLGRMPNWQDVGVAKTGMARAGYDPNNGYVERYMFGGRFEVHSLFGDFWIHLGIPGLILILLVGAIGLVALALKIRDNKASALEVFIAVNLVWNIAFSPLYSSVPATTVGIAVLLWIRSNRQNEAKPEIEPATSELVENSEPA